MKSGCLYEWVIWIICSAVSFKKYWGMNSLNKGTSQIDGCILVLSWIAWQSQCQFIFGELESENIACNWRTQTVNDASFNTGRMKNTKKGWLLRILQIGISLNWAGGLHDVAALQGSILPFEKHPIVALWVTRCISITDLCKTLAKCYKYRLK